jgi:hypothetical protein
MNARFVAAMERALDQERRHSAEETSGLRTVPPELSSAPSRAPGVILRFNRTLTQRPQRRCPRGASVVTSRTENNHGN